MRRKTNSAGATGGGRYRKLRICGSFDASRRHVQRDREPSSCSDPAGHRTRKAIVVESPTIFPPLWIRAATHLLRRTCEHNRGDRGYERGPHRHTPTRRRTRLFYFVCVCLCVRLCLSVCSSVCSSVFV